MKETVPVSRLGVHPNNRGGVYTQGKTAIGLGGKVCNEGFRLALAQHEAILQRAKPSTALADGEESFTEYNIRKSNEDELLAGLYDPKNNIDYAVLNHSHILQVSKGFAAKKQWKFDLEEIFCIGTYVITKVACLRPY